jgi:hypothetical protein
VSREEESSGATASGEEESSGITASGEESSSPWVPWGAERRRRARKESS